MKIPCRREQQPAPVFLPGKARGQRSLAGYSPWGHKELDTTEHLTLSLFFHNKIGGQGKEAAYRIHPANIAKRHPEIGTKRDIENMADSHRKRWPSFIIIGEMQIKTTMRYHLMLFGMAMIKTFTNNKCC